MKRVNIAVVGCGFIATTAHIPNILSIAEAKLVGLCDSDATKLQDACNNFNIDRNHSHSDVNELLSRSDIEAVVLCTPTPTHANIGMKILETGKHLFVEKPIAQTSSEAEALVRTATQQDLKLMVGHFMGFLPNHIKSRDLIRNGTIGKVFYAEVHSETLVIKEDEGMLLDYSAHSVDLMRWYFDDARIDRVAALLQKTEEEDNAESHANIILQFSNGVVGHIGNFYVPGFKNWDAVDRSIRILGTKGKIVTEYTTPPITVYKAGTLIGRVRGPQTIVPKFVMHPRVPLSQTSYRKEIEDFIDSIIHNRPPSITGDNALTVLRVLEAAKQSFEKNTFVEV
ncbi:MAG: Gfo/Idh/MocA family oxidoreductase [Chloroflexota bacterium]|nr:Gfo/Idh/MocA family oxidoreductase [Chloroflexota bacterium]